MKLVSILYICFLLTSLVFSQNAITPGEFKIDPPTPHCLGFRWVVTGDEDVDAKVEIQYKLTSESVWKPALDMLRHNGKDKVTGWVVANMFAGSVLNLMPGLSYDVKLSMTDPDNGALWSQDTTVTVSTNNYPTYFNGGTTVHVYPPSYSGTKESPSYNTVEAAANDATAGTIILIHAGVHDFTMKKAFKGTKSSPIVFRGAGDGEAILEGTSSEDMFDLYNSTNVYIEDLTLRQCKFAVNGYEVQGLVVRNCNIYNANGGVIQPSSAGKTKDWFIINNVMTGPLDEWFPMGNPPGWPSGVWTAGRNMVVCYNTITNWWDCMAPGYPGGPKNKHDPYVVSIDYYCNDLRNAMDDLIELDYTHGNVRVWGNRMMNGHIGFSAQPHFGGPLYIFRNTVYNVTQSGLKFHRQPSGCQVFNNTFGCSFFSSHGWTNLKMRNNVLLTSAPAMDDHYYLDSGPQAACQRSSLDYNGYALDEVNDYGFIIRWYDGKDLFRITLLEEFYIKCGMEEHGRRISRDDFGKFALPTTGVTYTPDEVDFRLVSNTALCVDFGCEVPTITEGYKGSAPDLGAFEYGDTIPHYGAGHDPTLAVSVKKNWRFKTTGLIENKNINIKVFPNPFREIVVISALAEDKIQSLKVYDMKGRMVYKSSVGAIHESPVRNNLHVWDGVDNYGRRVANGNYFIKINTAKGEVSPKVNFIR